MRNKESFIRYRFIDQRLRKKPAPTILDLVKYVEDKIECSVSTSSIQKDIYAMRNDELLGFNAPIEYVKSMNAYIYTDCDFTIDPKELMSRINKLKREIQIQR